MHFAVDGTLWAKSDPSLYAEMAAFLLKGLSSGERSVTLLGKTENPLFPVPPGLDWHWVNYTWGVKADLTFRM